METNGAERRYPIIEIFDSFQGEGALLGMPVTFIRFSGCNLSCEWCDTAKQLESGTVEMLTAEEVASRVHRQFVVFTGGEPTLYNLEEICNRIRERIELPVFCIETNGTGRVPLYIDVIGCSPKPQSGYFIDHSILDRVDAAHFKYVVDDKLEIGDITKYLAGRLFVGTIYLQPEYYSYERSVAKAVGLAEKLLELGYDVRLGIQAHKYWEVR